MKKIYHFIWIAMFGVAVNGQVRQPHSLYFMETIPQISQMNPAFQPRANVYVMLPANINIDMVGDLALKDILQQQGDKWYTPIEKQYSYAQLRRSIGEKTTMMNNGIDLDIIGFGFRLNNSYLSFGISEHVTSIFALPSDMFKVTENGFPDGTSLDFSPLRTQGMMYKQILIGYSGKLSDKLTIGVNVKPMFGQVAFASKIKKFDIHTGERQWDLDVKGDIYSSLPVDQVITDENGKIDEIKFRDVDEYKFNDWLQDYGTDLNNPGIALDIGAAYQMNERLALSVALNNLGFISWKEDLNGLNFNGKTTFNGVAYDYSTDDIDDLFKNLGDSILAAFNYKVQHDKFKTVLPPLLYAGASYQLSRSISVGLLSRTVFWKNNVRQSFNMSLCLQPYSFVAFNAGATFQVKGSIYMGGGLTFFLGPLQFFLLADYIPVYYSTLRIDDGDKIPYVPEQYKTFTVRTGLNLVFGKHGYVNKPMLDKGKSSWN